MGHYFDDSLSMAHLAGEGVEKTLSVVADRYVSLNPPAPLTYRAYTDHGILRGEDYRYHADLASMFPEAQVEQCVHAWAKMWSPDVADLMFDINCQGPLVVYLNGVKAWRSDIFSERYPDRPTRVTLTLREGWNHFVISAKKTRGGFGWAFGSWLGKHPYVFMMPSAEREGQEGWLYTAPMAGKLPMKDLDGESEARTEMTWLPERKWPAEAQRRGQLARIYGLQPGRTALGWTRLAHTGDDTQRFRLEGRHHGATRVFVDDTEVFFAAVSGAFEGAVKLTPGSHDLMVLTGCNGDDWGFDLTLTGAGGPLATQSPCDLQGSRDAWIYAGPFDASSWPDPAPLRDLCQPHETADGLSYWRVDAPRTWVRMYNENPLFSRWNYPLGVTVYGLLHAGQTIGSEELLRYVAEHVQLSCRAFPYAQWDLGQFGGHTHAHRLLSSIDSLDDCGSFGSSMLEVARHLDIEGYRPIADFVAEFIRDRQDRFPDGAFYRREMMHAFHENTMWADDLYMSVPFLCRYYLLTGEARYIDDAANQFIGFRKRLYLPEVRLMSHVFDLRRGMATGVPWGRGNGWTLFSLSELLEVLPEDHARRPELLDFFRELCSGIRPLQDEAGMWHQVLDHPDAYPETSCTAMFIYAFSRGVRNRWLEDPDAYADAALKAWDALNRISIDREGNVHGVCRGSEFSFTPDYYKYDLLPRLNDTHGIGIVLLAGVEVSRLQHHLDRVEVTA